MSIPYLAGKSTHTHSPLGICLALASTCALSHVIPEIYTLLLGLNWFFIESDLNSAANPKESCKVETKIQSSYKDAVHGEEFGLNFANGSNISRLLDFT